MTESSGDDERDCSEHRPLSDSETESVELETKRAKIPGPKSVGKKNTPSENPHSGKILKVKLPIEATLKFSKELWNSLYKEAYTKNGKIYLPRRWTNVLTKKLGEIEKFHCCPKFKRHFVPKDAKGTYLFTCSFDCRIGKGICNMKGKAILSKDFELRVVFQNRNILHEKGAKDSFAARFIRGQQRVEIAKELTGKASPSKVWHQKLSELNPDDFDNGHLKNMGNSKNVYKTIKSEAAKLSLPDKDLVTSVMKLKGFYERSSTDKIIKGFIQSFNVDPFSISLWTQSDIEIYHRSAKKLPIILDATCGIIAAINDTRVFYFAMIIHNGSVKTEPIPLFQFLTDKPDEHSITSASSLFINDERKRYGYLNNTIPIPCHGLQPDVSPRIYRCLL